MLEQLAERRVIAGPVLVAALMVLGCAGCGAGSDASSDAGLDGRPDAGSDGNSDARSDAGSGSDGGSDGGSDARSDAGCTSGCGARQCGPDPKGCLTSCGTCSGGASCNQASGQCEPPKACGNDSHEPNDSEAKASDLALGVDVEGILCATDADWYRLSAGSADTAIRAIVAVTASAPVSYSLVLTDCQGATKGGWANISFSGTLSVGPLAPAAQYCLSVEPWEFGSVHQASYRLRVEGSTACDLDDDCATGSHCPFEGTNHHVCQPGEPGGTCGEPSPGSNETSSRAIALTSGSPVSEDTCYGGPTAQAPDVDWFTFEAQNGDRMELRVSQDQGLGQGKVKVGLLDAAGTWWAVDAGDSASKQIDASGLPAGRYYVVVAFDAASKNDPAAAAYTIEVRLERTPGCASRDDCAMLYAHGECDPATHLCAELVGSFHQGPGQFCDDDTDCDPLTSGSPYTSTCFNPEPRRSADNACTTGCYSQTDEHCTSVGMQCLLVSFQNDPPGVCVPPCLSDAGCLGVYRCDVESGICK